MFLRSVQNLHARDDLDRFKLKSSFVWGGNSKCQMGPEFLDFLPMEIGRMLCNFSCKILW